MRSTSSRLPRAAVLWLPLAVLAGGLVIMGIGGSALADENRSAGVFPGRVVATGERTAEVEFTGPDGRSATTTVGIQRPQLRVGEGVRMRVWPAEQRAELDFAVSRVATLAVGGVLALIGAAITVLAFLQHHRERRRPKSSSA